MNRNREGACTCATERPGRNYEELKSSCQIVQRVYAFIKNC